MSIETASSFNELQKVAIQEIAFGNPKYSFVLFGPPGTFAFFVKGGQGFAVNIDVEQTSLIHFTEILVAKS